ncbi:MAG: GPR endopeptidase [Christensenellaceae bacterium]|nr:GPR endopeptidase [Christensenellaceae bacterium]
MGNIRTDMALEIRQSMKKAPGGVKVEEHKTHLGMRVTRVDIENARGSRAMGRPVGSYVTVETEPGSLLEGKLLTAMEKEIGRQIKALAKEAIEGTVLVVGLGNRQVTPDALGPKAVENVLVTRHIHAHLPEFLEGRAGDVCALAPGVLGVTGLETAETVRAVCRQVKPSLVVAIDALAARSSHRIGTSVQLCDTGIAPGSGIGNHRSALDRASLGARVLGIGVPMVVYASTVASDLLEAALGSRAGEKEISAFKDILCRAEGSDLIVTPKNVDMLVRQAALLIAGGINRALHPKLSGQELAGLLAE